MNFHKQRDIRQITVNGIENYDFRVVEKYRQNVNVEFGDNLDHTNQLEENGIGKYLKDRHQSFNDKNEIIRQTQDVKTSTSLFINDIEDQSNDNHLESYNSINKCYSNRSQDSEKVNRQYPGTSEKLLDGKCENSENWSIQDIKISKSYYGKESALNSKGSNRDKTKNYEISKSYSGKESVLDSKGSIRDKTKNYESKNRVIDTSLCSLCKDPSTRKIRSHRHSEKNCMLKKPEKVIIIQKDQGTQPVTNKAVQARSSQAMPFVQKVPFTLNIREMPLNPRNNKIKQKKLHSRSFDGQCRTNTYIFNKCKINKTCDESTLTIKNEFETVKDNNFLDLTNVPQELNLDDKGLSFSESINSCTPHVSIAFSDKYVKTNASSINLKDSCSNLNDDLNSKICSVSYKVRELNSYIKHVTNNINVRKKDNNKNDLLERKETINKIKNEGGSLKICNNSKKSANNYEKANKNMKTHNGNTNITNNNLINGSMQTENTYMRNMKDSLTNNTLIQVKLSESAKSAVGDPENAISNTNNLPCGYSYGKKSKEQISKDVDVSLTSQNLKKKITNISILDGSVKDFKFPPKLSFVKQNSNKENYGDIGEQNQIHENKLKILTSPWEIAKENDLMIQNLNEMVQDSKCLEIKSSSKQRSRTKMNVINNQVDGVTDTKSYKTPLQVEEINYDVFDVSHSKLNFFMPTSSQCKNAYKSESFEAAVIQFLDSKYEGIPNYKEETPMSYINKYPDKSQENVSANNPDIFKIYADRNLYSNRTFEQNQINQMINQQKNKSWPKTKYKNNPNSGFLCSSQLQDNKNEELTEKAKKSSLTQLSEKLVHTVSESNKELNEGASTFIEINDTTIPDLKRGVENTLINPVPFAKSSRNKKVRKVTLSIRPRFRYIRPEKKLKFKAKSSKKQAKSPKASWTRRSSSIENLNKKLATANEDNTTCGNGRNNQSSNKNSKDDLFFCPLDNQLKQNEERIQNFDKLIQKLINPILPLSEKCLSKEINKPISSHFLSERSNSYILSDFTNKDRTQYQRVEKTTNPNVENVAIKANGNCLIDSLYQNVSKSFNSTPKNRAVDQFDFDKQTNRATKAANLSLDQTSRPVTNNFLFKRLLDPKSESLDSDSQDKPPKIFESDKQINMSKDLCFDNGHNLNLQLIDKNCLIGCVPRSLKGNVLSFDQSDNHNLHPRPLPANRFLLENLNSYYNDYQSPPNDSSVNTLHELNSPSLPDDRFPINNLNKNVKDHSNANYKSCPTEKFKDQIHLVPNNHTTHTDNQSLKEGTFNNKFVLDENISEVLISKPCDSPLKKNCSKQSTQSPALVISNINYKGIIQDKFVQKALNMASLQTPCTNELLFGTLRLKSKYPLNSNNQNENNVKMKLDSPFIQGESSIVQPCLTQCNAVISPNSNGSSSRTSITMESKIKLASEPSDKNENYVYTPLLTSDLSPVSLIQPLAGNETSSEKYYSNLNLSNNNHQTFSKETKITSHPSNDTYNMFSQSNAAEGMLCLGEDDDIYKRNPSSFVRPVKIMPKNYFKPKSTLNLEKEYVTIVDLESDLESAKCHLLNHDLTSDDGIDPIVDELLVIENKYSEDSVDNCKNSEVINTRNENQNKGKEISDLEPGDEMYKETPTVLSQSKKASSLYLKTSVNDEPNGEESKNTNFQVNIQPVPSVYSVKKKLDESTKVFTLQENSENPNIENAVFHPKNDLIRELEKIDLKDSLVAKPLNPGTKKTVSKPLVPSNKNISSKPQIPSNKKSTSVSVTLDASIHVFKVSRGCSVDEKIIKQLDYMYYNSTRKPSTPTPKPIAINDITLDNNNNEPQQNSEEQINSEEKIEKPILPKGPEIRITVKSMATNENHRESKEIRQFSTPNNIGNPPPISKCRKVKPKPHFMKRVRNLRSLISSTPKKKRVVQSPPKLSFSDECGIPISESIKSKEVRAIFLQKTSRKDKKSNESLNSNKQKTDETAKNTENVQEQHDSNKTEIDTSEKYKDGDSNEVDISNNN